MSTDPIPNERLISKVMTEAPPSPPAFSRLPADCHSSDQTIATQAAELARLNEVNERLSKIANARLSPLESAVGHTIDQLRETVATHDQELRRWQDEIRDAVIRHSGAPDSRIDGVGCDSGDPLALSLVEISQGFAWITDKHAETVANVTRERDEAREHLEQYRRDYVYIRDARDAAIIERNDLLAINRGYISDNAQLQSALDKETEKRQISEADWLNKLATAIAERDEARTARDLAKGIINPLQREVDSLASQLDQLRREFATLTEWHNDLSDKLQQERARVRELEGMDASDAALIASQAEEIERLSARAEGLEKERAKGQTANPSNQI